MSIAGEFWLPVVIHLVYAWLGGVGVGDGRSSLAAKVRCLVFCLVFAESAPDDSSAGFFFLLLVFNLSNCSVVGVEVLRRRVEATGHAGRAAASAHWAALRGFIVINKRLRLQQGLINLLNRNPVVGLPLLP